MNLLSLPWFTDCCVQFLSVVVTKEMDVFEYGSGGSTVWFSQRVKSITSVDSDMRWTFDVFKLNLSNVDLIHRELPTDKQEYVKAPLRKEQTFDVIVIDGRERNECCKISVERLNESGVIILDNSERERYSPGIGFLLGLGFNEKRFEGPGFGGEWTTSIFYRKGNCFNL